MPNNQIKELQMDSKFWQSIFDDSNEENANRDELDQVKKHLNQIVSKMAAPLPASERLEKHVEVDVQLPTEPIEKSHGHCHGCENDALLGNKLCVKCWDYVVDHSSANAKKWPSEMQYHAIKAR